MRAGLTLPNRQWDPYTPAELAALDDLSPGVIVWLLYGSPIDQLHKDQLRPFIEAHHPRILYRPYYDSIPMLTTDTWARRCANVVTAMEYPGELIPDNERNLAVEHGDESWDKHIVWLKSFAREWRKRMPSTPLHLGALSPSGNYRDGLEAYRAAGLWELFDVVDFHCYSQEDVRQAALATRLDGPVAITEFNRIDPSWLFGCDFVRAKVTDCISFLLGGTKDQEQFDILKQPAAYQSFKAWRPTLTTPKDFTSPNHGGPRPATVGIVLHGTLGDSATPQTEFDGTVSWFNSAASQVSAHAVVGPGGVVWRPIHTDVIGWHCRASNAKWLGLEMAKPRVGDQILPEILDTAAKIVAGWCHDYEIPLVWSTTHGLAEHHEMPTNTDGHQDVGGPFDRADFLARVKRHAGQGDELSDAQKKAVLDDLDFLWSYSTADQIKKNPAESEKVLHERIVGLKVTLGLQQG